MPTSDALAIGREHFWRHAWGEAYVHLLRADQESPLGIDDLELLAAAAFLTGRDDACTETWARAHQVCLDQDNVARAARDAFWLGFGLVNRGEYARGGGWLARARRLLDDAKLDCAERGYLLVPTALQRINEGDFAAAYAMFTEVGQLGRRFRDVDLATLGRLGQGQTLVHLERIAEGLDLLDEVMIAVTTGEVSPMLVGLIYCAVIEVCHELFDLRRAQEWTTALSRLCASEPDLVPYRGLCLVHRAEILQLHGAWSDALTEAQRASAWLSHPPGQPGIGPAFYQQAELHRLRGELQKAEEAYAQASQWGHSPQPGLALLRLAQGNADAAAGAIRRVVDETHNQVTRARLLAAFVEIMLAVGDIATARAAADELSDVAATLDVPLLHAVATYAAGSVLLAEGGHHAALDALRSALTIWLELDIPYEAARAHVLIGLACRQLGDEDSTTLELSTALDALRHLGARPEIDRVEALLGQPAAQPAGGLTGRELEVLRMVAAGKSNRAIAGELFLSEKTVARHVSNIFTKLDVSSRTAAAAYAFEHDLL